MPTRFRGLLEATTPESLVRRALGLFEADFRHLTLIALADWRASGVVSPVLFEAPIPDRRLFRMDKMITPRYDEPRQGSQDRVCQGRRRCDQAAQPSWRHKRQRASRSRSRAPGHQRWQPLRVVRGERPDVARQGTRQRGRPRCPVHASRRRAQRRHGQVTQDRSPRREHAPQ